jgi:hypothetical protein
MHTVSQIIKDTMRTGDIFSDIKHGNLSFFKQLPDYIQKALGKSQLQVATENRRIKTLIIGSGPINKSRFKKVQSEAARGRFVWLFPGIIPKE